MPKGLEVTYYFRNFKAPSFARLSTYEKKEMGEERLACRLRAGTYYNK